MTTLIVVKSIAHNPKCSASVSSFLRRKNDIQFAIRIINSIPRIKDLLIHVPSFGKSPGSYERI